MVKQSELPIDLENPPSFAPFWRLPRGQSHHGWRNVGATWCARGVCRNDACLKRVSPPRSMHWWAEAYPWQIGVFFWLMAEGNLQDKKNWVLLYKTYINLPKLTFVLNQSNIIQWTLVRPCSTAGWSDAVVWSLIWHGMGGIGKRVHPQRR